MRTWIIQSLSVLFLALAVVWFIVDPGFEPVITAIAGLAGLFSGEFLKSSQEEDPLQDTVPAEDASDPTPASSGKSSIIVLPFDNFSPDPGDAYFSDGLTEEIITDLSYLGSLRVISRSSAMVLKGTQKDVRTIGEELGVEYVLEGSVRKAGEHLRITAQLIDAGTDEHLWAKKYDGVLNDVFEMQEQVSRSIVEELALELTPREERFIETHSITNLPAYESYLKARLHVWEGTAEALDQAVRDLATARELVGETSLLNAVLGYVYFQKANFGFEQEEAVEKALEHAGKALAMDEECALAEVVLGASHQALLGNQAMAIRHLERARSLDPNNPDAVIWLQNAYLLVGNMDRALALADLSVQLDPLNPVAHGMRGFTYLHEGDFHGAIASTRRAFEMDPGSPHIPFLHSMALAYGGESEELTRVRKAIDPSESVLTRAAFMMEAAARGDREDVLRQLTDDVVQTARRDCQVCWFLAGPLAKVGEAELALDWMERALEQGFINHQALSADPFLANLQGLPSFEAFLTRVEAAQKEFEV